MSRQWKILVVNGLEGRMVETMEIVQWVTLVPYEVVCRAKDAVVIGRVCYIVTHPSEKLDVKEYLIYSIPWKWICTNWKRRSILRENDTHTKSKMIDIVYTNSSDKVPHSVAAKRPTNLKTEFWRIGAKTIKMFCYSCQSQEKKSTGLGYMEQNLYFCWLYYFFTVTPFFL